jgi:hypothetical protein
MKVGDRIALFGVTFSVREAVAVTRTRLGRVLELVKERDIKPVVYGAKGAGNGHRLSAQQLYALAAVGALHQSPRGCSRRYVREVFTAFEAMSDAALQE